jgi:hypothetical protein
VGQSRSTASDREVDRGRARAAWYALWVRLGRTRLAIEVLAALVACGTGCTFLVDFVEKPLDAVPCEGGDCLDGAVLYADPEAGSNDSSTPPGDETPPPPDAGGPDPCATLAEGAACRDADSCNDQGTCVSGKCVAQPKEAGTYCTYFGGCNCGYCDGNGQCSTSKRCPEGFNWDAKNKLARCCGGLAVTTDNNANCGVCGVTCKTAGVASPQSCKLLDGEYLCVGCTANSECWSKCCSSSPTPSHCAASDCSAGKCPSGLCPAPSKCVEGSGNSPNYCTY